MGWAGSDGLGSLGAPHDRRRKSSRSLLLAVFCLALILSSEASAQTAPWDIESVQHRLAELGYDVGEVDGLLGPKTRSALRAFQADRDLSVTGLPDGDTQRALSAAQPSRSESVARLPGDDPPSLEAVPLGPVEVAPLAPMIAVTPHEGPSGAQIPAEPRGAAVPAAEPDRGPQSARSDWLAELGSWETGLKWTAVALGVLGAVSLIAAAVLKLAKRSPAVAERPRPAAPPATARTRTPSSTTTRGAHVFGVDVPPSRDSEAG